LEGRAEKIWQRRDISKETAGADAEAFSPESFCPRALKVGLAMADNSVLSDSQKKTRATVEDGKRRTRERRVST